MDAWIDGWMMMMLTIAGKIANGRYRWTTHKYIHLQFNKWNRWKSDTTRCHRSISLWCVMCVCVSVSTGCEEKKICEIAKREKWKRDLKSVVCRSRCAVVPCIKLKNFSIPFETRRKYEKIIYSIVVTINRRLAEQQSSTHAPKVIGKNHFRSSFVTWSCLTCYYLS